MRKAIKWVALGVVLLVVVVGVVVYMSLNSLVRSFVERQTTASLNVPAKVGGAFLSLTGGSLSLSDFGIGSPPGFKAPEMFALDSTSVQVNYGELRGNPIHIQKVVLNRPKLVVEHADMKLNLQALMQQIPQKPKSSSGKDEEPTNFIIDEMQMNDAQVAFRPGLPGLDKEVVVPIKSFTLRNIGQGEGAQNGAAMKDVAMMTMTALAQKGAEVGNLPTDLNQLLSTQLGPMAKKLGAEFDKQFSGISTRLGKDLPAAAGKTADDAAKTVGKEAKGLLDQIPGAAKEKK